MQVRWTIAAVLAALMVVAVLTPSSAAQSGAVRTDIDGDRAGDLLVGVPLEDVGGMADVGSVNVLFSNGRRLKAARNVALTPAAVGAEPVPGAAFGSAVALVDINGDGHADAVVGASGDRVNGLSQAGSLTVVPGSSSGLVPARAERYAQGTAGLVGTPEAGDFFGFSAVGGDFNADGFGDVAVAAPYEDVDGQVAAGAVTIILGSPQGLDAATSIELSQASGVAGSAEPDDNFGWTMAVGDFDDDSHDDLAVGVPGEDVGEHTNAGAVNVFYGSPTGITTARNKLFSQKGSVREKPEPRDFFGFAVAASDVTCDGRDDLLVGVPNESVGGSRFAGYVNVIRGSKAGLRKKNSTSLQQRGSRVAGQLGFNQFGASLAGGDFDGDGCGDIAIGAYTTDVGGDGRSVCVEDPSCAAEAGAVVVVYGDRRWPTTGGTAQFTQEGAIPGRPQAGDFFGRTLAVFDANGDQRDELVVGIPREDVKGRVDAGAIAVLRGSRNGLTSSGSHTLSQKGAVQGAPERGDQFSSALFDGGS